MWHEAEQICPATCFSLKKIDPSLPQTLTTVNFIKICVFFIFQNRNKRVSIYKHNRKATEVPVNKLTKLWKVRLTGCP